MNWTLFEIIKSLTRLKYLFKTHKKIENSLNESTSYNKITSIVSWNIQGLFIFLYPYKIHNIIKRLRSFNQDIICLQEVFDDNLKKHIIEKLKYKYPYYLLGNQSKKYIVGEDSGLLILSKYKIQFCKEVILPFGVLPDNLSNKSILYFSVGDKNILTTHLQSSNMIQSQDIVEKQMEIMRNESPFKQYIITGDLNHTNVNKYLNIPKNNEIETHDDGILDYIIPINYSDKYKISIDDKNIDNVSDHYPIIYNQLS